MRMKRSQRQKDQVVSVTCGIALFAAAAAACILRGFFFAGEMYVFLTIWFAGCTALACWVLVQRAAAWGAGIVRVLGRGTEESAEAMVELPRGEELPAGVEQVTGRERGPDRSQGILLGSDGQSGNIKVALLLPACTVIVCIFYGIHVYLRPLSLQGTLNELLRWGLYTSFAVFALLAAGTRRGGALLAALWHSIGIVISLSALLAVCGSLPVPYAVAYSLSPEVSVAGARLAGLLQYPNTFGAVMAVFLLERLFAAAYASRREEELRSAAGGAEGGSAEGNAERRSAVGGAEGGGAEGNAERGSTGGLLARLLPLFPYAAALLLSESRGAWLAAACAAAAALLSKRQLLAPLLLAGAAPAAGAALLYRQLARTGLAADPLPGLLLLAGLWAGALLAGLWLHRRWTGAAGRQRAAMLALAAAAWTAAGSAVLLHVRARITGPSPTADARVLFYRDAWKLAAEAPWLGRGGETWRQAYLAAQSRPYAGSQVHSGYLDILLNLGMAGLGAVLLLLLAAGWLTGKASPRLLPPLLVIVLHSAVDFDWSYGLIWLLLLLLPAWALAEAGTGTLLAAVKGTAGITAPSGWLPVRAGAGRLKLLRGRAGILAGILLACALSILCGVVSLRAAAGSALYRQAASAPEPAVQATLLRQSLEWNKGAPLTAIALSKLLPVEQGTEVLRRSLACSPGNAALNWELAERYLNTGSPGEALYWVRRSLRLDKYNAAKRMAAVEGMLMLGERELTEGDKRRAAESADAGLALLRQYSLLARREYSRGPQHNDRGFRISGPAGEEMHLRLSGVLAEARDMFSRADRLKQ